MRCRLVFPLLLLLAGALPPAAGAAWLTQLTAAAPRQAVKSGPLFLVTGHGWGHGVGMSQYGALGYAEHGWTYRQIVGHFFPGTTIGAAPVSKVRVLLRSSAARIQLTSPLPFTVKDAAGKSYDLAAGTLTVGPGLKLKVGDDTKAKPLDGPLTFLPAGQPLALDGRHYRGSLQVDVVAAHLRVIDVVGLEAYLYGVVPSEMPSSWAPEALKAQAVAARSYALAVRRTGGAFDLYSDTRSQMYLGVDHERPTTTAAVDATAGQVALFGGQVATTYFFSTSGGRTASPVDAWGGNARAVPYLQSVADPYDTVSPYHDWGPLAFGGAKLARSLHVAGIATDVQTTLNGSGRVATLTVTTTRGSFSVPGPSVRTMLGLRSSWFSVGVLSLNAPSAPVTFGSTVALTGVARGVSKVDLQQRVAGGAWQTVTQAVPKNGGISIVAKPTAPTSYRLVSGTAAAGAVRVAVAPLVRISEAAPGVLRGFVKPALPKLTAVVQRLEGATWTSVSKTPVADDGKFEAHLPLADGMYRVRVAPGRGYAAGTSPPLKVVNG